MKLYGEATFILGDIMLMLMEEGENYPAIGVYSAPSSEVPPGL
jgi:hypothetical protein